MGYGSELETLNFELQFVLNDQIDIACTEFETARAHGPTAILDFLEKQAFSKSLHEQVCRELIMIDVDYRLRSGQDTSEASSVAPVLLTEYLEAFPDVLTDQAATVDLVTHEFTCRLELEMQPSSIRFLRAFPTCKQLEKRLIEETRKLDTFFMNLDIGSCDAVVLPLGFDTVEFGRKHATDTDPITEFYGEKTRRVIMAFSDEKKISRRHFHIERCDQDLIQVKNVSSKSEVLIGVDLASRQPNETKLQPGESTDVHLLRPIRKPKFNESRIPACKIYVGEKTVLSIYAND